MFCAVFICVYIRIFFDSGCVQTLHTAQSPSVSLSEIRSGFAGIIDMTDLCLHGSAGCHCILMDPYLIAGKVIGMSISRTSCRLLMVALIILQSVYISIIKDSARKLIC